MMHIPLSDLAYGLQYHLDTVMDPLIADLEGPLHWLRRILVNHGYDMAAMRQFDCQIDRLPGRMPSTTTLYFELILPLALDWRTTIRFHSTLPRHDLPRSVIGILAGATHEFASAWPIRLQPLDFVRLGMDLHPMQQAAHKILWTDSQLCPLAARLSKAAQGRCTGNQSPGRHSFNNGPPMMLPQERPARGRIPRSASTLLDDHKHLTGILAGILPEYAVLTNCRAERLEKRYWNITSTLAETCMQQLLLTQAVLDEPRRNQQTEIATICIGRDGGIDDAYARFWGPLAQL